MKSTSRCHSDLISDHLAENNPKQDSGVYWQMLSAWAVQATMALVRLAFLLRTRRSQKQNKSVQRRAPSWGVAHSEKFSLPFIPSNAVNFPSAVYKIVLLQLLFFFPVSFLLLFQFTKILHPTDLTLFLSLACSCLRAVWMFGGSRCHYRQSCHRNIRGRTFALWRLVENK